MKLWKNKERKEKYKQLEANRVGKWEPFEQESVPAIKEDALLCNKYYGL